MKRGRRRNPKNHNHKSAPVDRRIIPVDDGDLRTHAARECKKAMAKLDKACAELRRFEQEDRRSFARWMASTFGALMTEIRDNSRLIDESEALIDEVEMEMMWSNHRNPRRAYAAVINRREDPSPDEEEEADASNDAAARPSGTREDPDASDDERDEDDFDPQKEMGAKIPKAQRKVLFEDFLKSVFGINPKRMNKAEYAMMFIQFEKEVFGRSSQEIPFQTPRKKPVAGLERPRIKEIYRMLVRRLHPDMRADGDARVSAIWHEVQEAYETRNLDRLETLLALTEMQSDQKGGQASLFQMRGALEELNRSLRAIQRSIRGAKLDPAWGFSQTANRGSMEKRIRRELEENLTRQRRTLANLKLIIEEWSRHPPTGRPRRPGKQPRPPANPTVERPNKSEVKPVQTEFFAFR